MIKKRGEGKSRGISNLINVKKKKKSQREESCKARVVNHHQTTRNKPSKIRTKKDPTALATRHW